MASAAVAAPPVAREELFELHHSSSACSSPSRRECPGVRSVAKATPPPSPSATSAAAAASSEIPVAAVREERALSISDEPPLLTGPTALPQTSDDFGANGDVVRSPATGVVVPRHSKLAPYKPGKMTVVLDMDECLLHSKFHGPGAATEAYRQCEERPDAVNELGVNSFWVALDDGDTAQVNKRPGLDPFLEALARDYNTIVFTAAMPDYAGPVLDYIDPKGTLFHRRLYRSSCRQVKGAFLKDLTVLGVDSTDMSRTVLVDNNPLSFICQPTNGVLVASFYDDPADTALASVMQLIRHLDQAGDVRPILKDMFRLDSLLGEYRNALFDDDDQDSLAAAGSPPDDEQFDEEVCDLSSSGEISDDDLSAEIDSRDEQLSSSMSSSVSSDVCLFDEERDNSENIDCGLTTVRRERTRTRGPSAVASLKEEDDDDESVKTEACSEESSESSLGESLAAREELEMDLEL